MRARTMTGVTASVADDGHEQNRNDSEDEDTADVHEVCDAQRQKWVLQNFIIPLKACYQLPSRFEFWQRRRQTTTCKEALYC